MINGSDFFAAERYICTLFLLLILGGVPILAAVEGGSTCWHIPPRELSSAIFAITDCIASAALIIM
jgi:hypothetical protein